LIWRPGDGLPPSVWLARSVNQTDARDWLVRGFGPAMPHVSCWQSVAVNDAAMTGRHPRFAGNGVMEINVQSTTADRADDWLISLVHWLQSEVIQTAAYCAAQNRMKSQNFDTHL